MTTKEFFIQLWKEEVKTTITCLKAIPIDKMDYRPHQKTRSAKDIVEHIVPHADDLVEGAQTGVINHILFMPFGSMEEAISHFETKSETLVQALEKCSDSDWENKIVPMNVREHKVMEAAMYRMFYGSLFDLIHHRGQLSTYYRPMGTRNPSIYGPTAEMIEERMAAKN